MDPKLEIIYSQYKKEEFLNIKNNNNLQLFIINMVYIFNYFTLFLFFTKFIYPNHNKTKNI